MRRLDSAAIRPLMVHLGEDGGIFRIRVRRATLNVIASTGGGWDHVSVSVAGSPRVPDWSEMEAVKRAFFRPGETAMQLHVPPVEHIDCHPGVLHLWRPQGAEIPRPPGWMVGPREGGRQ